VAKDVKKKSVATAKKQAEQGAVHTYFIPYFGEKY
jgi:hypothetical protein